MSFGLSEKDIAFIVSVLQQFPEVVKAAIFGSRAKGTQKPGSDIDIAVYGPDITFTIVARIHSLLEEQSPVPYLFDIVDYTHLSHEKLKNHIDRVGQVFFSA